MTFGKKGNRQMGKVKLIPPDLKRCQAESRDGSFMTLGPREWKQCSNAAIYIATETSPGPDGEVGSMSLCAECREICGKQMGTVKFEVIKKK